MVKVVTGCMIAAALTILGGTLPGCAGEMEADFPASEKVLENPLIGYAHSADSSLKCQDCALVYIDITWKELEPEEGVFAWETVEAENHMEKWRAQGKHAVLRFVCDKPSDMEHTDIPDWLYEKIRGDGTHYNMEYGKGFSPNYGNETFIACHEAAIRALGGRYGSDPFVSYVQLGSLGHWGEWHVNYEAGIERLPMQEVRARYIAPYRETFPNAKLLMRRAFDEVREYGFGVYNDMAGEPVSTAEWLDWIQNGGIYNQTKEACLSAVPGVWDQAPVGGEFTSGIPMEQMLGKYRERTIELLKQSHTTFLGPKIPIKSDGSLMSGAREVLGALGYRLRVSHMKLKKGLFKKSTAVLLVWENDGTAPLYWDWPVYLYLMEESGEILEKYPVDLALSELIGGGRQATATILPSEKLEQAAALGLGIEDPMTGRPAVHLAMEAPKLDCITILYMEEAE